jgi:hypothetical protein
MRCRDLGYESLINTGMWNLYSLWISFLVGPFKLMNKGEGLFDNTQALLLLLLL